MCNCAGMCRDPVSEMEGREDWLPISNHHPKCEDYKLIAYAKITHGGVGQSLITDKDMVEDFIQGEVDGGADAEDYMITEILLTKDQYENLPEFDGF